MSDGGANRTGADQDQLERDAWRRANLDALTRELRGVRALLTQQTPEPESPGEDDHVPEPVCSSLDLLCETFGLTDFERAIVVLCAGAELDATFGEALSSAHQNPLVTYPTLGLAMRVLPGPHWSALAPSGPLRRWQLIGIGAGLLTGAVLRLDEWVLHALVGASGLDERLVGVVDELSGRLDPTRSSRAAAAAIAATWRQGGSAPMVLRGRSSRARRSALAEACRQVGWRAFTLDATDLPSSAAERAELRRRWEREARYDPAALLVEVPDDADPLTRRAAERFVERLDVPVLLAVDERSSGDTRSALVIDAANPDPAEQHDLWRTAFGNRAGFGALNGSLHSVVAQFDLDQETITIAAGRAMATDDPELSVDEAGRRVWEACRLSARGGLDDLAQRIDSTATFDDLVVPERQRVLLQDIVAQVRQRSRVYGEWKMAGPAGAGLGITALFAGPSGTGKTLAAGVVANSLSLDLYRIDLSQAVSKYIGETEKNLRRVFAAASESGAVLLFDEADALFGKRSEVRDSHDRYANMEVSYLLQAMEAYRGLAILTTNLRGSLDQAFLRRLRFVVTFPFPSAAERAEIWRHAFPAAAPTRGLDIGRLAKLSVSGGDIRSIALHAAFSAADAGTPIGMAEVLHAAATEYAKLDRQLSDAEIGGWA